MGEENSSVAKESSIGKKKANRGESKRKKPVAAAAAAAGTEGERCSTGFIAEEDADGSGVKVSLFDYSAENHIRAMDMISNLCGEAETASIASEIERLSSIVTFLREWKHYNYKPRTINFKTENPLGKNVVNGIQLPQFSSATVPTMTNSKPSKDFVMYVGGSVWALDWCPRIVHQRSECRINREYLAIAAHPPESSYHKMGVPLTGRGVVQIWCVLNANERDREGEELCPSLKKKKRPRKDKGITEENSTTPLKKPRGRPRKENAIIEENPPQQPLKKPKGRPRKEKVIEETNTPLEKPKRKPRKKAIKEQTLADVGNKNQFVPPLAVKFPEDSSQFLTVNELVGSSTLEDHAVLQGCDSVTGLETETQEGLNHGVTTRKLGLTTCTKKRRMKDKARAARNEDSSFVAVVPEHHSCGQALTATTSFEETRMTTSHFPNNVTLPRVVFCLAHNGKVAWDVKWQPSSNDVSDSEFKHRMGYLAVLLGNGALEVWEVPSLSALKVLYSTCYKEGTDPRFVKLEPVFRCSKLVRGDKQSIPLTVEWSTSFPHDLILAGCHDGTVALWKFTPTGTSQSTRPLLCFNAESGPIRAIAWAPDEGDAENGNIIVTGHGGLRFWDIRDPYRPLWDLNPVRRVVYGLDWLPHPRCIISSSDDGTLKILSMLKAASAYDVPVTGKPFAGTQLQGLNSYNCSSFTIWSIHASRVTGMVAYCGADGTVVCFEITTKAVEKDHSRNRAQHFLCGSVTEEDSILTVNTPLSDTPIPMKKTLNESGDTPRTIGAISDLNQVMRGNNQTSNDQILALCYEDDPNTVLGSGSTPDAPKSKKTPKPKTNKKKKTDPDQALSAADVEENLEREVNEKGGSEIEVLPHKIVAMHRVRWNMNKGSERWLCYGGAAGIVRCQEIAMSTIAK